MKYFKKFIMLLLCLLFWVNNIYPQQGLTQEEKQRVIDALNSLNSSTRLGALHSIEEYKITEAEESLKAKIWKDELHLQPIYLYALQAINSSVAYQFALMFIDTLDIKYGVNLRMESRVRAIEVLFKNGDYSKAEFVIQLLDRDKPRINTTALRLLKEIIVNVPQYAERAKKELIIITQISTYSDDRIHALWDLEEIYGEEMFDLMAKTFTEDEHPTNRIIALEHMLVKYKRPELNVVLRNRLIEEPESAYRHDIATQLLTLFGTPSDYQFVRNYISQEPDQTIKNLLAFDVEDFIPPEPDSTATGTDMIDTLISYNTQCYNYSWITNKGIYNSLAQKLENAKKDLEKGNDKAAKNVLEAFRNEVEAQKEKHITIDGYKFLYYYSGYIIERL